MLRLPQGRGKQAAPTPGGAASGREHSFALTRDHIDKLDRLFGQMDGRSVLALARSVERGELDGLCSGLDRTQLLESLRPALRRENAPRTPTLWRRLCRHAEHHFVDKAQHYPGAHWTIARPLVRATEGLVEAELPQWHLYKEGYAQAETSEDRLRITIQAADAVSDLLRSPQRTDWEPQLCKASGLPREHVMAGLDALAGCLGTARWYHHVQKSVFRRSDDEADLAFANTLRQRPGLDISDTQTDALHRVLTALSEEERAYAHYLLIQVSVDLRDRASVLKVAPPVVRSEMPEKLARPPYGEVIDFLVASIERGTREFVADVSGWRKIPIADDRFMTETDRILHTLSGVERQIQQLYRTIRLRKENPLTKRIEKARLAIGMTVASVVLPRCRELLDDSFGDRTPLDAATTAGGERLLASLLNVSWRMAESGGQNLAASTSKEQVFGLLSRIAVGFRPTLFSNNFDESETLASTLAHTACVAGRLGAGNVIGEMQDRLGPIWEQIPQLWPCRDGTNTCCRALLPPMG